MRRRAAPSGARYVCATADPARLPDVRRLRHRFAAPLPVPLVCARSVPVP